MWLWGRKQEMHTEFWWVLLENGKGDDRVTLRSTLSDRLWGWEADGNGSGFFPVSDCDIKPN